MSYHTCRLLQPDDVADIQRQLMLTSEWVDGKITASGGALDIKRNLQLNPQSKTYEELTKRISSILIDNNSILSDYIFPKKVINILFSRTSSGMFYGSHVDAAHTNDGRRDFSFTLFLNNPGDYEGGELIMSIPPEKKAFKLQSGSIVIYPTKYLHEVKVVQSGERLVCVGWIESTIKDDHEREILTHISQGMKQAFNNNELEKSKTTLNIAFQRLKKHFGD